jgi:endonuclease/exonuclease/phosphatase family metal-dependent hydrolase
MKVLTYNIQCDNPNYDKNLSGIFEFSKGENPDIIAFQEVKYGSYKKIIDNFPDYHCGLSNKVEFKRVYGELLLSKEPFLRSEYHKLSGDNMRGLTVYIYERYVVSTTHFEHGKYNSVNAKESEEILKIYKLPILFVGDFNFFEPEPEQRFENLGTVSTKFTFESSEWNSVPDRMYFSPCIRYIGHTVHSDVTLSDHCPLSMSFC